MGFTLRGDISWIINTVKSLVTKDVKPYWDINVDPFNVLKIVYTGNYVDLKEYKRNSSRGEFFLYHYCSQS